MLEVITPIAEVIFFIVVIIALVMLADDGLEEAERARERRGNDRKRAAIQRNCDTLNDQKGGDWHYSEADNQYVDTMTDRRHPGAELLHK